MRWFNLTGGGSQTETRQSWSLSLGALGQMTRLTVPGQLDLEYRFSTTANDGRATSQKNYLTGEELEYQYDSLGRLTKAETTANSGSAPQWGLSWVYDGFGNRLQQNAVKGTVPTASLLVDPTTNRVQSHTYDANGNTVNTPAQGAMTYDVANRLKTVASDTYAYAPTNQRTWKNNDFVLWGADGARLVTAQVSVIAGELRFTQSSFDSYANGRRLQVVDRLGSVGSYFPYGEAKSGTVSNADSFATYYRDSSALDYAQQRYFQSSTGRFLTPDPYGASGVSTQPGSFNRYPYAGNDPVNKIDPAGLYDMSPEEMYDYLLNGNPVYSVTRSEAPGWWEYLPWLTGILWTPPIPTPTPGAGAEPSATAAIVINPGPPEPISGAPINAEGPSQSNCPTIPTTWLPTTVGVQQGSATEAGLFFAGGSASTSVTALAYNLFGSQPLAGGVASSAQVMAYAGAAMLASTPQPVQPVVIGAAASTGMSIVLSNAQSPAQFNNIGTAVNVNIGLGIDFSTSIALSPDFSTWSYTIGLGPGIGVSASVTTGETTTIASTGGCK